jgi:hypothetical protein
MEFMYPCAETHARAERKKRVFWRASIVCRECDRRRTVRIDLLKMSFAQRMTVDVKVLKRRREGEGGKKNCGHLRSGFYLYKAACRMEAMVAIV